jgi:uncharacterized membrane protein YhaH (DUF805 family)
MDIQKDVVPTIKSCLTDKYLDFKGKSGQSEFAMFILFCVVVNIVAYSILPFALAGLIGLGLLIPMLAVAVRRLHDIDLPEILAILLFIPLVGLLFLIYIGIQPSKGIV